MRGTGKAVILFVCISPETAEFILEYCAECTLFKTKKTHEYGLMSHERKGRDPVY